MTEKIAVIGLGYVGLPLALAFARKFPDTVGFDIKESRVNALRDGRDETNETSPEELKASSLLCTSNPDDLKSATFFIVAVPTPVDKSKRPDLTPVEGASRIVAKALKPGDVVVYESTVYPGVTEDICAPILEKESGLRWKTDFHLGYSPERINPGDKEHTIDKIIKVVSGDDAETLDRVANTYATIVDAGVFRAASIRVAEAAKVIENTQRDLNIALMNELAIIFDKMGIRTKDVLDAAGTKWNFLRFTPGLVGGHCIGVDPYYLTAKAEELGYHPQVILAGRRINDGMGVYIAQRFVKMLIHAKIPVMGARVAVLGLTFKEDVPDIRNSRVPDIVNELRTFGVEVLVHDPLANPEQALCECGIRLNSWDQICELNGLILAVPHRQYLEIYKEGVSKMLGDKVIVLDLKSVISQESKSCIDSYSAL
jgi:UDP-N-acetyl-D-galactosamine dehydrogenase